MSSNIHTIRDFDDGPENRPMPRSGGGGGGLGGGGGGGGGGAGGVGRQPGVYNMMPGVAGQPIEDTLWSNNWQEGMIPRWYHLILGCFCPCFIGPCCSEARKRDYLAILRCSLLYIAVICFIYFIVEVGFGGGYMFLDYSKEPIRGETFIKTGAKVASLIKQGQVWRLFTAMFMHGGILHILMNMSVIFFMGLGYERHWWMYRMIPIYFLAGIFGNLMSCVIYPLTISVGASGAIFGFLFAKVSKVMCQWTHLNWPQRIMHLMNIGIIVILSIAISFGANVDWSAHLGGAIIGFLTGFIVFANFLYPLGWDTADPRPPLPLHYKIARLIVIVVPGILLFAFYLSFSLVFALYTRTA